MFDLSSHQIEENAGNAPVLNDYTLNPNGSSADQLRVYYARFVSNTGLQIIDKITMREKASTLVISICVIKILLAFLFLQGEAKAAGILLLTYPLRLFFYYNPWDKINY